MTFVPREKTVETCTYITNTHGLEKNNKNQDKSSENYHARIIKPLKAVDTIGNYPK